MRKIGTVSERDIHRKEAKEYTRLRHRIRAPLIVAAAGVSTRNQTIRISVSSSFYFSFTCELYLLYPLAAGELYLE